MSASLHSHFLVPCPECGGRPGEGEERPGDRCAVCNNTGRIEDPDGCLTLHECCLCKYDITYGNDYHDGGYGRRAHVKCVANALRELGESQANVELK